MRELNVQELSEVNGGFFEVWFYTAQHIYEAAQAVSSGEYGGIMCGDVRCGTYYQDI